MKKAELINRTITGVKQRKYFNHHTKQMCVGIDALYLDNGKAIYFHAFDTDGDTDVAAHIQPIPAPGSIK